jgi:hypothetical protein
LSFPPQHTQQKPSPAEHVTHPVKRNKLHWQLNLWSAIPSTVPSTCYPGITWRP